MSGVTFGPDGVRRLRASAEALRTGLFTPRTVALGEWLDTIVDRMMEGEGELPPLPPVRVVEAPGTALVAPLRLTFLEHPLCIEAHPGEDPFCVRCPLCAWVERSDTGERVLLWLISAGGPRTWTVSRCGPMWQRHRAKLEPPLVIEGLPTEITEIGGTNWLLTRA